MPAVSRNTLAPCAADKTFVMRSEKSEPDKPTRGRPAKPADQQTKPYSIRLTDAEIIKLKAIGMPKLRAWIRRQIVSA